MLTPEVHEQINAALRQALADCMPAGRGGIVAVWDQIDAYRVAPMDDLAVTFAEYRSIGLDILDALAALAAEIRADRRTEPGTHLIGLGLIGHAHMGPPGDVASLLALIDGWSHQILWPHRQATPVWEIESVTDVEDQDCAAYLDAFADLLDALTGQVEGGVQ